MASLSYLFAGGEVFIPKVRKWVNIPSIGCWFISILNSSFLEKWWNIFIICVCVCGIHSVKPPTGLPLLTDGFKPWQTQRAKSSSQADVRSTWKAQRNRKSAVWPEQGRGAECRQTSLPAVIIPDGKPPGALHWSTVSQSILVRHLPEEHRLGVISTLINLLMCQVATQTPELKAGKVLSKLQLPPGSSLSSEHSWDGWEGVTRRHSCLTCALISTHSSTAIWCLMLRYAENKIAEV